MFAPAPRPGFRPAKRNQSIVFIVATIAVNLAFSAVACSAATLDEAWAKVAALSFAEAAEMFTMIGEQHPAKRREADYGRAIALLNAPPTTAGKIEEARRLLTSVRDENDRDETGIAAWFYLARVEQAHVIGRPNYADALRIYRALGAAHPDHWYGQFALLKQAVIELMVELRPEERLERVHYWSGRAKEFTFPEFERNLERVLLWTCLFSDLPAEEALKHARWTVELQYSRADLRVLALDQVVVLARETGEKEIAIAAIRRFLSEFPRHQHRQLLLDYLAELTGANPTP